MLIDDTLYTDGQNTKAHCMLGQCVVSTPFILAIAETEESPDLAGEKTQTLQVAKALLFSGNPGLPYPSSLSMLNMWWRQEEEQLEHRTYS